MFVSPPQTQWRCCVHFAVSVRFAVTGCVKSYAVSPMYQPPKSQPSFVGSAGFTAAAPCGRTCDVTCDPLSESKVTVYTPNEPSDAPGLASLKLPLIVASADMEKLLFSASYPLAINSASPPSVVAETQSLIVPPFIVNVPLTTYTPPPNPCCGSVTVQPRMLPPFIVNSALSPTYTPPPNEL